jgi:hypothetical protein
MSQFALRARRLTRRLSFFLVPAMVFVFALPHTASAQVFSVTITVDENGNGHFTNTSGFSSALPFAMQLDPGPGGLPSALTYGLLNPPGLTAGDLVLLEPGSDVISDIIRFNPACGFGTGCLVFYSDNFDGVDALADVGFPLARYTNVLTVQEVGPEGDNGFIYTPLQGQPGFVAGSAGPVTYVLRSDSVPEFSSLGLLAVGLMGVAVAYRKSAITRTQGTQFP